MVVIEKRVGRSDRTVFITDRFTELINRAAADYKFAVNEICTDGVKIPATMMSGDDMALIRLPIPLDLPDDFEPSNLAINSLCWKTAAQFNYNHLSPLYLAAYGLKIEDHTTLDQPSLNWIRRVIVDKDFSYPNDKKRTYISDDNMGQLDRGSLLVTSTDKVAVCARCKYQKTDYT